MLSAGTVSLLAFLASVPHCADAAVVSPYRAAFGINDVRLALVERAREFSTYTSLAGHD